MIYLLPFLGVAALFAIMPGPNITIVTRNALRLGRKAALFTSFGILSGVALWTAVACFGIAAVLETYAFVFKILQFFGDACLQQWD